MNFKIKSQTFLADNSQRIKLSISGGKLVFLGFILESMEGWCNYTTVRENQPFLQIDIPADFIDEMHQLLDFLQSWEL